MGTGWTLAHAGRRARWDRVQWQFTAGFVMDAPG